MKFPAVSIRGVIGNRGSPCRYRDRVRFGITWRNNDWILLGLIRDPGWIDPDPGRQVGWLRGTLHKTVGVGDIGTPQGLFTGVNQPIEWDTLYSMERLGAVTNTLRNDGIMDEDDIYCITHIIDGNVRVDEVVDIG